MSDLYLDRLEAVLREGIHDLHDAADRLNLPYDAVCLAFNEGLRKKLWKITLSDGASAAA